MEFVSYAKVKTGTIHKGLGAVKVRPRQRAATTKAGKCRPRSLFIMNQALKERPATPLECQGKKAPGVFKAKN